MKNIVLLSLLCCGLAQAAPKDAQLIANAKTAVSYDLKDPDSAKFRNVRVIRGVVCGEINAKNALGAYTGFKRFLSTVKASSIDDDHVTFQQLWGVVCEQIPVAPTAN